MLRSPSYPDPTCDRAQHEFVYALLPHEGDFVNAQVYKQGYDLNVPLQTIPVIASYGHLPKEASYFEINSPHVMIEAIKKAEDRESMIVRLYEASGSNVTTDLHITIPFQKVTLVDLLENELEQLVCDGESIHLHFTPFEIKTLEITL